MYFVGKGVPNDYAKAVYLLRKAAEQGHAGAQYNLGMIYAKGEGVPEDYVRAYAWTSVAAAQGIENAQKNKGVIEKEMTREQIAEAQKLASKLWGKYVLPFQKN